MWIQVDLTMIWTYTLACCLPTQTGFTASSFWLPPKVLRSACQGCHFRVDQWSQTGNLLMNYFWACKQLNPLYQTSCQTKHCSVFFLATLLLCYWYCGTIEITSSCISTIHLSNHLKISPDNLLSISVEKLNYSTGDNQMWIQQGHKLTGQIN